MSSDPAGAAFTCSIQAHGRDARWARLAGELDIATAESCERALNDALRAALLLVLDLRELAFIDSTGARVVDRVAARARRNRQRLVTLRGPAQIERVLTLTGVADRLEIIDIRPALVSPILHSVPAPQR